MDHQNANARCSFLPAATIVATLSTACLFRLCSCLSWGIDKSEIWQVDTIKYYRRWCPRFQFFYSNWCVLCIQMHYTVAHKTPTFVFLHNWLLGKLLHLLIIDVKYSFLFFFLSYLGWHTLPSHASAEACLTGWPNSQPQGRDWCSVARHHQANLMVCVVCSCCATSPYRDLCRTFNHLIATLKPQSNTVIGTVTVDGWAVTFGTARRGLSGAAAHPGPSSLN